MRKKYFIALSALFLFLCVVAAPFGLKIFQKGENLPIIERLASIPIYEDLEALEKVSPLIIKAKVLEGSENIVTLYPDGTLRIGYTVTPVEILEKYKDTIGVTDETIRVSEAYYVVERADSSKYLSCIEGYRPLKIGKEYLLFLYYDDVYSLYPTQGVYQGKFPLSEDFVSSEIDELSLEQLEIGDSDDWHYKNLAKEVKEKYLKKDE